MGKASSAKKVARAARTGGKTQAPEQEPRVPGGLVALVVLGVGLVVFARGTGPGDGDPRAGRPLARGLRRLRLRPLGGRPSPTAGRTPSGIHTHEDGIIHIHPFLSGAAGDSATLGQVLRPGRRSRSPTPRSPCPRAAATWTSTAVPTRTARPPATARRPGSSAAYWADALTADGTEPDDVRTSDIAGEHFESRRRGLHDRLPPRGRRHPGPAHRLADRGAGRGRRGRSAPSSAPDRHDLPEAPAPRSTRRRRAPRTPVPVDPATATTEPADRRRRPGQVRAPAGG